MYLSKLTLNLRSRLVQKELANRYELHRTLTRAFSAHMAEEERILFRLEEGDHTAGAVLLVQSSTIPDWPLLPERYLLFDAEVKSYSPRIHPGQVLIFRLLANPTKRINAYPAEGTTERESKRVRLLKEEEHFDWLDRKAAANGFHLLGVRSARQPDVIGYSRKKHTSLTADKESQEKPVQKITLQAVQFDGILEVTDPEAVISAVRKGIGPAKGFGFGLLSLARAD